MKKILINTPFGSDANSFWRCIGPMQYMAKNSGGDIQCHYPQDGMRLHWDRLADIDLIFMHRPCRPQDLTLIQMAKLMNIPVWSDFDDWLFGLPAWNPQKPNYDNPHTQATMAAAIACSDIVSVSTEALQKKFSRVNPNVIILPNAYRSDLFPYRNEIPEPREKTFAWRGSQTHDGDMLPMLEAFKNLEYKTHFLGGAPYSLTSQLNSELYQTHEFVDPLLYWKKIHGLKTKVWLAPLKDDFFNHCKSNISWIEATHAGAICVAPDLDEWKRPGVITYNVDNPFDFEDACNEAIEMDVDVHEHHVNQAYQEIKLKYDIQVVNQHRRLAFDAVFQPGFKRNIQDPFNPITGHWAVGVIKGEE